MVACFAFIVTACGESPKEVEQEVEIEQIEMVEEKLDEATETLNAETESLEEEVDELLEGI